ncbi:MAG: hypothetical protein QME05_02425 [Candidatus Margulisbacteria bacterium]|nr:hypothetical protein [Candidatus Margulisiibacteriota bacterium]
MSLAKFKDEIIKLSQEIGCFCNCTVLNETNNTVKIKLDITRTCFVQIYANFRKNLKNYVVILDGQRIFGRDSDGGRWHKHPWENPSKHLFEEEVLLRDFLFETYKGLINKGIL